jgi:hypothetical protein
MAAGAMLAFWQVMVMAEVKKQEEDGKAKSEGNEAAANKHCWPSLKGPASDNPALRYTV